jgi:hypothetical protein
MDEKHFRKNSQPNVYSSYAKAKINEKQFQEKVDNVPDNRYASWPAIMADARYTDYSPRCSKNVSVGKQFPTKQWLIHSAENIIEHTRTSLPVTKSLDKSVLVPSAQTLECTKYSCSIKNTNTSGIGIERPYVTPHLFGTFGSASYEEKSNNTMQTQLYEGGRNSRHGLNQMAE